MNIIQYLHHSIDASELIQHLKQKQKLSPICQEFLAQSIIYHAALAREITVEADEIQAEANKIRLSHHLEKASDTMAWLQKNMLTADEWESAIRMQLLSQKLALHLFQDKVDGYFAQHRFEFEEVILYQIEVSDQALAEELYYQIIEEEISFYEAAHLYHCNTQARHICGYLHKTNRHSFAPQVAAIIFQDPLPLDVVIGPIEVDQRFHLLKIEQYIPAELNDSTRQKIIDQLFKAWLGREFIHLPTNEATAG